MLQGIKNLCSGFSYCLSLLETFYVWHGRGSRTEERQAALKYAQSLSSSPDSVIELVEGQSDQDEMFWLILGEGDYAKADYWQWRSSSELLSPRVWQVNSSVDRATEYVGSIRFYSLGELTLTSGFGICSCRSCGSLGAILPYTQASIFWIVTGSSSCLWVVKHAGSEEIFA